MKRHSILIDTDIALGIERRDVDDGLALLMAKNSPVLELGGITLTYGNDSLENIRASMANLIDACGSFSCPVAAGASECLANAGPSPSRAAELIKEFCRTEPHRNKKIIGIGPVTNIATALELYPEIKASIEEIILVAGRRPGQRFLTGDHKNAHPDLNFERDPEAMQMLIDSGISLTLAPFEVSSKVWITSSFLEKLEEASADSKQAAYLSSPLKNWLALWQEIFSTPTCSITGFNPFDCLAVAWLTDRDLLSWTDVALAIEEDDYDTTDEAVQGTGSGHKQYLHVRQSQEPEENIHRYIHDVDQEEFLKRLLERLTLV